MEFDISEIDNTDHVNGASALVEIAAMARVAMLSAGGDMTQKRADQMERDAIRLQRRGKSARAEALQKAAVDLRAMTSAIGIQREKEQIRPLIAKPTEAILQGRATDKGTGKAGLKVSLVDGDGKTLAQTVSGPNGAFTLRQTAAAADATLVIADADGKTLGEQTIAPLKQATARFVDLPVETLKPARNYPADSTIKVPDLAGRTFANALRAEMRGLIFGDVMLTAAPEKAGYVVEQTPLAGAKVSKGTPVNLVVGTGKAEEDHKTARLLIQRDPRVAESGLTARQITALEKRFEVASVADFAALSERDVVELTTAMPEKERKLAEVFQMAAVDVAKRFPGDM